MKVVFISNYFNHHQAPFSEAMNKLTNGNYWFVAVEEMSEERKNMGWEHDNLPDYVIKSYKSKESLDYAKRKIEEADTVIFGLSGWKNFKLIQKRLRQKKLTFRYSERIYKAGFKWHRFPIQALKHWLVGGRCRCLYMLCAILDWAYMVLEAGMRSGVAILQSDKSGFKRLTEGTRQLLLIKTA